MAYETKVVILSTTNAEGTIRLREALETYAENHHRVATFEHITAFFHPYTHGSGEVFVGHVNHLDEGTLMETVATAVEDPGYRGYHAALSVIFNSQDDDHPRTKTLTNDGDWI